MSAMEIVVVIGGLLLGYWIMAVFVPSLWDGDRPAGDEPERADDRADANAHHHGDEPADFVRWFDVLQIPESSSREEIIASYKRLIGQYRPDTLAQMGQELEELAEIRSREINAAYVIALKLRSGSWHA
jgi:hypothetical protein